MSLPPTEPGPRAPAGGLPAGWAALPPVGVGTALPGVALAVGAPAGAVGVAVAASLWLSGTGMSGAGVAGGAGIAAGVASRWLSGTGVVGAGVAVASGGVPAGAVAAGSLSVDWQATSNIAAPSQGATIARAAGKGTDGLIERTSWAT